MAEKKGKSMRLETDEVEGISYREIKKDDAEELAEIIESAVRIVKESEEFVVVGAIDLDSKEGCKIASTNKVGLHNVGLWMDILKSVALAIAQTDEKAALQHMAKRILGMLDEDMLASMPDDNLM